TAAATRRPRLSDPVARPGRRHGCACRRPRERAARAIPGALRRHPPLTTTALRAKEHMMNTTNTAIAADHPVVSPEDWTEQRGQAPRQQRDFAVRLGSRAAVAEIERFGRRMGWRYKWASASGNDFNLDFRVSFPAGTRIGGEVFYNCHMSAFPKEEAPGISF